MKFSDWRKKRVFALSGSSEQTILAEISRLKGAASPTLKIISATEGPPDQELTIQRLLASVQNLRGTVSVTLPLYYFQTVTLSIPIIPEEAVSKALPYHLAKNLDKPLQDFIFDWQITRRHADHLEITAYLFPAEVYRTLRQELARKQLELKYLEPDVFAAFAYLEATGRLPEDQTILCSLIWPGSSSHAIYEQGQLKLVRSVPLSQPEVSFAARGETPAAAPPEVSPGGGGEGMGGPTGDESFLATDDSSILDDFALSAVNRVEFAQGVSNLSSENDQHGAFPASGGPLGRAADWPEYINSLGLEIIRSRDFYGLILKGSGLSHLFVGGGEEFLTELGEVTKSAMNLEPEELLVGPPSPGLHTPLIAICLGTGIR